MNKRKFIKKLQNETNFSEEKCTLINDVLEKHFLIGNKNRENIINDLKETLSISKEDAIKIYNVSSKIILNEVKNKIIHPFR